MVSIPTTLNALWDDAFGKIIPETPFLIWQDNKKTHSVTWKEAIATAYCMAGFLLSRNIKRGDTFGVFASNNPALIYVELGARLLGAIPVMIPEQAITRELSEIARQTSMKMIMVSDPDTYHKALAALGVNFTVKDIITLFDDEQVLVPGRTAIFEWLIDPGKVFWRENLPEIKALRDSVVPDDICSISYRISPDGEIENTIHTHQSVLKDLLQAEIRLKDLPTAKSLMPCVPFWNPENRLKGFYLPLRHSMRILLPHGNATVENSLRALRPELALMSGAQLNGLYERILGKISHKGWYARRRYQQAFKTGARYLKYLDNGQKPGLWLRWRYRQSRKFLRKGILLSLNPQLKGILLSTSGLSEPAVTLFIQMDMPLFSPEGARITRENRPPLITMNPEASPFIHKIMPEVESMEQE